MLSTLQSLFLSFQYASLNRLKVSRSEVYRTQTLKMHFFYPFDLTRKLNIKEPSLSRIVLENFEY